MNSWVGWVRDLLLGMQLHAQFRVWAESPVAIGRQQGAKEVACLGWLWFGKAGMDPRIRKSNHIIWMHATWQPKGPNTMA